MMTGVFHPISLALFAAIDTGFTHHARRRPARRMPRASRPRETASSGRCCDLFQWSQPLYGGAPRPDRQLLRFLDRTGNDRGYSRSKLRRL